VRSRIKARETEAIDSSRPITPRAHAHATGRDGLHLARGRAPSPVRRIRTTHAAPARKTAPAARASIVASAEVATRLPARRRAPGTMDPDISMLPDAMSRHIHSCVRRGDVDGIRKWIAAGGDIKYDYYNKGGLFSCGTGAVCVLPGTAGAKFSSYPGTPLHGVLSCGDQKMAVSVEELVIDTALVVSEDVPGRGLAAHFLLHVLKSENLIEAKMRALAKCLLRVGASPTGLMEDLEEFFGPLGGYSGGLLWRTAKTLVDPIVKHDGWNGYARWHKQVLVGLVTKCSKRVGLSDDAAGLVVDFYCPSGGS